MDFDTLAADLGPLLVGVKTTVYLAVISLAVGAVLGLAVAAGRTSRSNISRSTTIFVIAVVLATPVLIQLLWLYYLLPIATGIMLPDMIVLIFVLSLNQAVVMGENYRSGFQSIPVGQRDAAKMLGLARSQIFWYVVLPQAMRAVLPLIASSSIVLVKDSAIATFIGANDLLNAARNLAILTFRPIEIFTLAAVLYFVLTYPMALLAAGLERYAAKYVGRS